MLLGDGEFVPLGVRLESASPAGFTLADATLEQARRPAAQRPAGAEAQASDRRPRLRLRTTAGAMETARHRVDRALPEEQQRKKIRGWTETATLQTALENRTHQRLAQSVPPRTGPSRTSPYRLPCLLSSGLSLDNPTEMFLKHALATPLTLSSAPEREWSGSHVAETPDRTEEPR